jgi:hypothetical protein
MRSRVHFGLAALLVALTAGPAAAENPHLLQAKQLYGGLEYERCVQRLDMASRVRTSTPREKVEIDLYGGLCQYQLGHSIEAERHFISALRQDPEARLPAYTSPKIVEVYQELQKRLARSRPREEQRKPPPERERPAVVERPPKREPPPEKEKPALVARTEPKQDQEPEQKNDPEPEQKNDPEPDPPSDPPIVAAPEVTPEPSTRADAPRRIRIEPSPDSLGDVSLVKSPAQSRTYTVPVTLAGAGLAATAVGIIFGVNAADYAKLNKAAFDQNLPTTNELGQTAKRFELMANISYGFAAASAVSAAISYLVISSEQPKAPAP